MAPAPAANPKAKVATAAYTNSLVDSERVLSHRVTLQYTSIATLCRVAVAGSPG